MQDLVDRYRLDGDLLSLLKAVRQRYGAIGPETTEHLADSLQMKDNDLYAVKTFYAFLAGGTIGRHVIRFCRCLPCSMKDADAVLGTIERELGIKDGETTTDGRYTLQKVNCIGACDKAPALMIDETRHGNLTPSKVVELLAVYK